MVERLMKVEWSTADQFRIHERLAVKLLSVPVPVKVPASITYTPPVGLTACLLILIR